MHSGTDPLCNLVKPRARVYIAKQKIGNTRHTRHT